MSANFRKTWVLWLVLGTALVAFVATSYLLQNSIHQLAPQNKTPVDTARRINLTTHWRYALETGSRAPGDLPSPPANGWEAFDPVSAWPSTQGLHFFTPRSNLRYWLKTDFQIQYPIQTPAIVLGKVPGSYRVFLNGHNIGEFDAGETLAYAAFDPAYFKLGATNQVLVSVHETTSLFHGFASSPEVGSFVGEFNDVRKTVALGIAQPAITATTFFAVTCGALVATLIMTLARLLPTFSKSTSSFPKVVSENKTSPTPVRHELEDVHKKIVALVKATKSTLYVAHHDGEKLVLEASSIIGSSSHVRQTLQLNDGLIASACEAQKPWLIHDIGDVLQLGSRGQYNTRSCIIIPLFSYARGRVSPYIVGVLTMADREGSVAFSEEDLALAVEASSQLVLLLDASLVIRSRLA